MRRSLSVASTASCTLENACVKGEDFGATCTGTKGPPSGKLLSLLAGGFSLSNARPVSAIATRRRSAAAMAGARSCPNVSICLRSTPSSALAAIASRAGKVASSGS